MANNQHITILSKGSASSSRPGFFRSNKSLKLTAADGALAYSRGNTTAKPVQRKQRLNKDYSSNNTDGTGKVWTNKVWKRGAQTDSSSSSSNNDTDSLSATQKASGDEHVINSSSDGHETTVVPILKGPKVNTTSTILTSHRHPATNQNWSRTSFKAKHQTSNVIGTTSIVRKDKRRMHQRSFNSTKPSTCIPKAKRIKLYDRSDDDDDDGGDVSGIGDKVPTISEKGKSNLTDFAYRQTSGPTTRNLYSKGVKCIPTTAKSRGLVRVGPKESDPICKQFLRGECNNVHCKKRHDIPRSAATPVCSFFQKGGMCFRDDCPFLHIKVNMKADICKMFNERGYCDNPDCRLKHFRGKFQQKANVK